jgi:hypothetical protein
MTIGSGPKRGVLKKHHRQSAHGAIAQGKVENPAWIEKMKNIQLDHSQHQDTKKISNLFSSA